jgi:hypothetical protein
MKNNNISLLGYITIDPLPVYTHPFLPVYEPLVFETKKAYKARVANEKSKSKSMERFE